MNEEAMAGGNPGGEGINTVAIGEGNQPGQNQEKTYSEKEFQGELDRRVESALKTAKEKWQTEYDAKLQNEKDEAARLAKLSEKERAEEQFKREKESFNAERSKFAAERLKFECARQLNEEGLPASFSPWLTGKDAEETKTNIEKFKEEFSTAIQKAVEDRVKSKTPGIGTKSEETDAFLQGFGKI